MIIVWVSYVESVYLWGESVSRVLIRVEGCSQRNMWPGHKVKASSRAILTARHKACIWLIPLAHLCVRSLPACRIK